MAWASSTQATVRPCLERLTRPASDNTSRCFITAGSDISNGAARSLTDIESLPLSCARIPRRVRSDSAAKIWSSRSSEYLTIWFSNMPSNRDRQVRNRDIVVTSSGGNAEHLGGKLRIDFSELQGDAPSQ